MPGVGGRRFPYTPAGQRQAKKYARKTGQPMRNTGGYGRGMAGGYGQGMDRRGGARTGVLSKTNRPSGMKSRPSSLGNRKRRRPGLKPRPRTGLGSRRGY